MTGHNAIFALPESERPPAYQRQADDAPELSIDIVTTPPATAILAAVEAEPAAPSPEVPLGRLLGLSLPTERRRELLRQMAIELERLSELETENETARRERSFPVMISSLMRMLLFAGKYAALCRVCLASLERKS